MPKLSKNDKKLLADAFRIVADQIENSDWDTLEEILQFKKRRNPPAINEESVEFSKDIYSVVNSIDLDTLTERLNALGIDTLKEIISKNGLDTTGRSLKWKDRERLVSLIIERVGAKMSHGKVFFDQDAEEKKL